ncbi:uncharacterized protein CEXT_31991 [Caerostris extrusa]|uniref:Uncharacterized protein n=1 Tax=Caerostris extrusa TaxID=172846 RepID=A0AAV4RZG0_CAEEX|nr:uncharacterized protein CEXT_31991 [Caerostris extrusa]
MAKKTSKIQYFSLSNREDEAFYPWMVSPVFFSIHSSVIPENPLTTGKAVRPGYQYKVSYRLEEEHLLPLPYATNCTDYDALWRQNNKKGPRSQQMCVYMCLRSYNKRCSGCEGEQMMHEDPMNCVGINFSRRSISSLADFVSRVFIFKIFNMCIMSFYGIGRQQEVLPDSKSIQIRLLKQKYHYTVEEIPLEPFTSIRVSGTSTWRCLYRKTLTLKKSGELSGQTIGSPRPIHRECQTWNRIDIEISLIDRDVTVISHIPRYGMWELFSYIGGLIGCWLGISQCGPSSTS